MSAFDYDSLRAHIGHKIECVCYGKDKQDPHNAAVECVDCGEVLLNFNHPDVEAVDATNPKLKKKYKKDHEFVFVGDIKHPGRVVVKAKSFDEAVKKVEDDFDFEVYDEQHSCLAFEWNGDEDTVEVE
jgi:hypothetical protein